MKILTIFANYTDLLDIEKVYWVFFSSNLYKFSTNFPDNNKAQQETASDRPTNVISSINIAIDWDPTALHLRYQSTREKVFKEIQTIERRSLMFFFSVVDGTWICGNL